MVDKNCDVPHHLSERLDSDGAYGWKHDFVPDGFDGRSRDALVVVFRSAATWAPKMKAIAYNQDLDGRAKRLTLAQYVAAAFAERGRTYAGVLAMRDAKYKQYRDVLRRCPNAIGVRYEDLAASPAFLFAKLATLVACRAGADFRAAAGHAKFGVETTRAHADAPFAWTRGEWAAVLARLDRAFEASLGFAYVDGTPGAFAVRPPPPETDWLTWR